MRPSAATLVFAVLAAAQKQSDTQSNIDLTVTSADSTLYYALSTNVDNGYASQTVVTIPVSAPSDLSTKVISNTRPTDDVPNLPAAMSTSENANPNTMIMSTSSESGVSDIGPITITGSPPAATGCTQFTTVNGTPSPLCIFENTTALTTVFSTQTSDPATEVSPHPASSFPPTGSQTGSSPSMSMPTHMTSSQSVLPPPPSWTEGPVPSMTIWLNSSMTFTTSTRSKPSQMMPMPMSKSHSQSVSHSHSMSHSQSMSKPHDPQSAGGYTMTKDITETIHSTTTVHQPQHSPMPPHHSPKPMTVTHVVMTTVVATVTADGPRKSECMEHTITKTKTVTHHMSMPHESSQSLIMISQLSDGQINGPTVSVSSMTMSKPRASLEPSNLSLHPGPPMVSPSGSAIADPLQTMSPHGTPHPSMSMPHPSMGMPHASTGMPPHGHSTGSTTCTDSMGHHDGTATRSPPVPFPTQPMQNATSMMMHSHDTRLMHEPTLSAFYSQTMAAQA